eukprot:11325525-Alexandrium_andersonii.AAC.1
MPPFAMFRAPFQKVRPWFIEAGRWCRQAEVARQVFGDNAGVGWDRELTHRVRKEISVERQTLLRR